MSSRFSQVFSSKILHNLFRSKTNLFLFQFISIFGLIISPTTNYCSFRSIYHYNLKCNSKLACQFCFQPRLLARSGIFFPFTRYVQLQSISCSLFPRKHPMGTNINAQLAEWKTSNRFKSNCWGS